METCVTLGMLTPAQAFTLKEAGLDYYNHNLDTSEENYSNVATFSNGVPGMGTKRLIGTLPGCFSKLAKERNIDALSVCPSPKPKIPPLQTLISAFVLLWVC
jgi:hypothetical protein